MGGHQTSHFLYYKSIVSYQAHPTDQNNTPWYPLATTQSLVFPPSWFTFLFSVYSVAPQTMVIYYRALQQRVNYYQPLVTISYIWTTFNLTGCDAAVPPRMGNNRHNKMPDKFTSSLQTNRLDTKYPTWRSSWYSSVLPCRRLDNTWIRPRKLRTRLNLLVNETRFWEMEKWTQTQSLYRWKKSKFVSVHDMQAYRGRRSRVLVILNTGNGRRWVNGR